MLPPPGSVASGNLFEAVPDELAEEQVVALAESAGARVERIVSTGQASPEGFWYDQVEDELVIVLRGRAGLEMEGEESARELGAGDWIHIPARRRHRVAWTADDGPTVWLAVHFPGASMSTADG